MPRKSTKAKTAPAESEEAAWYATPEGRRRTRLEFARALRSGAMKRSPGLGAAQTDPRLLHQLMEQARRETTRPISIRIPIADLDRARQIAAKTGSGYQAVLKKAIREGLKKAG